MTKAELSNFGWNLDHKVKTPWIYRGSIKLYAEGFRRFAKRRAAKQSRRNNKVV